jgi:hypothetical protein
LIDVFAENLHKSKPLFFRLCEFYIVNEFINMIKANFIILKLEK